MSDKGAGGEEVRYPRRWKHRLENTEWKYAEQSRDGFKIIARNADGTEHSIKQGNRVINTYWEPSCLDRPEFVCRWIETFDHHEQYEPEQVAFSGLERKVASFFSELDKLRAKLSESEAAAAKMRECLTNVTCALGNPRPLPLVVDGVAAGYIDAAHKALSANAGREFLAERDKMQAENAKLREENEYLATDLNQARSELDQERGRVEAMQNGFALREEAWKQSEERYVTRIRSLEDEIDTIGQRLTLPPQSTVERILEEIDYVREKARGSYHDKWKDGK